MSDTNTDAGLAALRDSLNRQRNADQLNEGDQVRMPWGQVRTVEAITVNGEYLAIKFEDSTELVPAFRADLFFLAN